MRTLGEHVRAPEYRVAAPIDREQLEAVLHEPSAQRDVRVGAALALRVVDPTASARIRVAAENSADTELQEMLAAVAEDDEEALAYALQRRTR